MSPKEPVSSVGDPLRIAISDAYERASALSAYFGRLTGEVLRGVEPVPTAPELAEVEAAIDALSTLVREIPRLLMDQRHSSREKIDEAAQG